MRTWLKSQLKTVEEISSHPEPDQQHFDQLREIVSEAGRRAAQAGLPECLAACAIRPGPISVAIARKALTKCLAAIEPKSTKLLTVAEAAERFNIGKRTLYRMIESDELPVSRARGAIRIKPADLESCLKQEESLFG